MKKHIFYLTLIFSFFLFSCNMFLSKDDCSRIIEKEKMIEIMTDMYLLESYLKTELTTHTMASRRDSAPYYYASLFKKYDVSRETFAEAFRCYGSDRDEITSINEKIMNTLSIMYSMHEKRDEILEPVTPDQHQ